ncbi:hypothetical protein Q604_UNBC04096G0001, partial [human gut metagenome]
REKKSIENALRDSIDIVSSNFRKAKKRKVTSPARGKLPFSLSLVTVDNF